MAFWLSTFKLESDLTPDECMARLRAEAIEDVFLASIRKTAAKPVFGKFALNSFALRVAPPLSIDPSSSVLDKYLSDFFKRLARPPMDYKSVLVLPGVVTSRRDETTIRARWSLQRRFGLLGAMWLGMGCFGFLTVWQGGDPSSLSIAVASLFFALVLLMLTWLRERPAREVVLKFLEDKIGARRVA